MIYKAGLPAVAELQRGEGGLNGSSLEHLFDSLIKTYQKLKELEIVFCQRPVYPSKGDGSDKVGNTSSNPFKTWIICFSLISSWSAITSRS